MTIHEISLTGGQASMEHEERTVLKFLLTLGDTTIPLPASAIPLHVGQQDDNIYVWIEVPTGDASSSDRIFQVYGTGWPQHIDLCHAYIGTVVTKDTEMVWHVYETHKHTPEELDAMNVINSFIGELGGEM